jgi:hypothetical protein
MIGYPESQSEFLPGRRGLLPHPRRQLLFALLSAADLALTWWLLGHSDGQVYEANPVARWWLTRFGWLGLAGFKAAVVLLVVALTAVIAPSRPRSAGRLLGLGCACLAVVVFYSAALCREAARSPEERAAEVDRECREGLARINREAARERRKSEVFAALRARLCRDLRAGRCTLREAAERLLASERGRDGVWLRTLAGYYPGRPPEERVAAWLRDQVARLRPGAPAL